ncbi:DUF86 domain-containing protein [Paenibacillus dendritiformis]|uniref:DUF86 domain-containing protein n=1 Tax=Paenibacillus dendritiformis C454 TaxID=1131935 RepID=H3SMG2_9BACL|nr:HepT-like ribonuclease domain-containing protein [Paenibacillus dendritiformis]EHQ59728.1 hypothetical protein PDENDC454_23776 [Paenibacillus dendritiformis C454]PZM66880.1 DUF86 domain-containing protein [Paenibacillus dendritiformis]WGU94875.1 DUF86 domain-containing protein [Paenibacillus dendritiformis]CAH8772135.1 DUF86 domain-containing protein [Paenibacillus dendritiformis]
MYYVNTAQIEERLNMVPELVEAANAIRNGWDGSLTASYAQERALHIAIELITDVGSLLIDGFMMRDASSYEDIVDILSQEGAIPERLHDGLLGLVRLRKSLVQDYAAWKRGELHPALAELPELLPPFAEGARQFIAKEMI